MRHNLSLLSRSANALYWMSRYIERAENLARMVDVNQFISLDLPGQAGELWVPLLMIMAEEDAFAERYPKATAANIVRFLTFDDQNPNSLLSCLRTARENARSVRELLSLEMWEQVNSIYWIMETAAKKKSSGVPWDLYREIKMAIHLFDGLMLGTMPRGEAWHFCVLGRQIERADKTSRILDVKYFILLPSVDMVGSPYDAIQWGAVLRSASAFEMYRKTYGSILPLHVAEFLLTEADFPRSVRHCVHRAQSALQSISGTHSGSFSNEAERLIGQMRAEMDYLDVAAVIEGGLHEFLDNLQGRLNSVDDGIDEAYFALRPSSPGAMRMGLQ